jgi:cell division protein FtsQ
MSAQPLLHGFHAPAAERARLAPAPQARVPAGAAALLAVLLAVAFGVLYVLNPTTIPIRHVEINGSFVHLSPAALQSVAEKVVRGGFFNVNVDAVRSAVMKEPWVRDVTVRRVWPQSLSLAVQEQQPAARWGAGALLNRAGELFRPDPVTIPDGLPLLSGPSGTEQLVLERYRHVTGVIAGLGVDVAELGLSERRAWTLRLASGQQVILGRANFVERVQRFAGVVQRDLAGRLDQARVIDMRYTNGFAVRWREGSGATEAERHGETH